MEMSFQERADKLAEAASFLDSVIPNLTKEIAMDKESIYGEKMIYVRVSKILYYIKGGICL